MYTPSRKILENYAAVLIDFALNSGKGIKKNEVVFLATQEPGIPLAQEVYKRVLEKGGHPIIEIRDDSFKRIHLENASDKQLLFFPKHYYRGLVDEINHWVRILADSDPMFLKKVDPQKIMLAQRSSKQFRNWLDQKEDEGRFTWTLCLYGTEGMAKEANLPIREYWKQIEDACFLNDPHPTEKWKGVFKEMNRILRTLNRLSIDKVHVTAPKTDLWISVGEKRRWLGGSGRNIPSFEVFTSPDWRGTEGKIFFDLPLYRFGNIIKDISLEFKKGKIVKATARKNQKLLLEMIAQKNADKIGEFSLTDTRFSHITKFMANTLFDENYGGTYGNTHLAVGKSYHDTYDGVPKSATAAEYKKLGFNDSVEHTDIIASSNRQVEAIMKDGSKKIIYEHGNFTI